MSGPSPSRRSTSNATDQPCFFNVLTCLSVVFLVPSYAVLHSTTVPPIVLITGFQKSGPKKFWFPSSPECSLKAIFPVTFLPRASYISNTFSGVIVRVNNTLDFIIIHPRFLTILYTSSQLYKQPLFHGLFFFQKSEKT